MRRLQYLQQLGPSDFLLLTRIRSLDAPILSRAARTRQKKVPCGGRTSSRRENRSTRALAEY